MKIWYRIQDESTAWIPRSQKKTWKHKRIVEKFYYLRVCSFAEKPLHPWQIINKNSPPTCVTSGVTTSARRHALRFGADCDWLYHHPTVRITLCDSNTRRVIRGRLGLWGRLWSAVQLLIRVHSVSFFRRCWLSPAWPTMLFVSRFVRVRIIRSVFLRCLLVVTHSYNCQECPKWIETRWFLYCRIQKMNSSALF